MARSRIQPAAGQLALPIQAPPAVPSAPEAHPMARVAPKSLTVQSQRIAASWRWETQLLEVLREAPELQTRSAGEVVRIDLQQAAPADDLERATDYFAAYSLPAARLALRVRSFEYLQRFGHEVVLRASTPSGAPSEAQKILTDPGSAQYYVYAFADPQGDRFVQWVLIDLDAVRKAWADVERRVVLEPRHVAFGAGERGLVLSVAGLKRAGAVVRALLVTPSFYSLGAVREYLSTNLVYSALGPNEQTELAVAFLRGSFQSTFFIGRDPGQA